MEATTTSANKDIALIHKRRRPNDWDSVDPIVRRLYIDERRSLSDTMRILRNQHGFEASYAISALCQVIVIIADKRTRERTFKNHIKLWGLSKYAKNKSRDSKSSRSSVSKLGEADRSQLRDQRSQPYSNEAGMVAAHGQQRQYELECQHMEQTRQNDFTDCVQHQQREEAAAYFELQQAKQTTFQNAVQIRRCMPNEEQELALNLQQQDDQLLPTSTTNISPGFAAVVSSPNEATTREVLYTEKEHTLHQLPLTGMASSSEIGVKVFTQGDLSATSAQ